MTDPIETFDVYGRTNKLDDSILEVMANRLESRGKHPAFRWMLHQYLDSMNIDELPVVLDLGCGTGFVAREIGSRHQFDGQVIGIDISSQLINRASQLSTKEGQSSQVNFRVGDTRSLDLEKDSFDAVIAHTLISHLSDPDRLIAEMMRLAKPGGYIAIFDGDYASLTFGNPDVHEGKRIDELIINSVATQPRILRQLPHLFSIAGLEIHSKFANIVSDIGKADFWATNVESMRNLLPAANAMTSEQAESWANERSRESEVGSFFASCNFYSYVAKSNS